MEKIKILHIIKSLGRGGAEMLLPETLRFHDREKFTFTYAYFLPWKDQMVSAIELNGGKVVCFDANNNLQLVASAWKIARYVRNEEIRLIHAHLPWAGIVARIVGLISGVPVVYTEHNKLERYHAATRLVNLATMNFSTRIIAVSSDVASSIAKYKPKLRTRVQLIANGVNTEHFRRDLTNSNEVRKSLNIPPDTLLIGTIAVFRDQKRLDVWMELASRIANQFKNVQFIVVGDGPLKESLTKKRESVGLKNLLHFPGLVSEVRPYLAAIDIYMMTSIFEGLPIALLEAMSMGCAIITTDAGGIKEVIRNEIDGLVCPADEVDKLVDFAASLIRDRALRQTYGLQARKRAQTHFGMPKMVNDLERTYIEVLQGRNVGVASDK